MRFPGFTSVQSVEADNRRPDEGYLATTINVHREAGD